MFYNEYKYLVSNEKLPHVRDILQAMLGGTDPFPEGCVDSLYFDTYDRRAYGECLNGDTRKRKFRIRGYGDNTFHQLHQKDKDIYGVSKMKAKIKPVTFSGLHVPQWYDLIPAAGDDTVFSQIQARACQSGFLMPTLRVRYYRYRFRCMDYRITLDTRIEFFSCSNGSDVRLDYAMIPQHVLEVKTSSERPHLPFLGIIRLPQTSFSKYFMGMNIIEQRVDCG